MEKDYNKALEWYKKAAAQGDIYAKRKLEKMTTRGEERSNTQDYKITSLFAKDNRKERDK